MQFINLKSESFNSVLWLVLNKDSKDKRKGTTESWIAALHKSVQKLPPVPAEVEAKKMTKEKEVVPRPIKVDDIAWDKTPQITFSRRDGKDMSLIDYYQEVWMTKRKFFFFK